MLGRSGSVGHTVPSYNTPTGRFPEENLGVSMWKGHQSVFGVFAGSFSFGRRLSEEAPSKPAV
jgi:hypothetical protein